MKKARLEDASSRVKKVIDLKDSLCQYVEGLREEEILSPGHVEPLAIICQQIHKELTELQRFIQAVDIELNHKPSDQQLQESKDAYGR